jgi:hypothetical protein
LSKYLKYLGLKKKRYNDGYYYYGIINKELSNNKQDNDKENIKMLYETYENNWKSLTQQTLCKPNFYNGLEHCEFLIGK